MTRSTVVAIALAFASLWVVMAADTPAVWLTEEVRAAGVVALAAAIAASLLVRYFGWRARLQRRILAEDGEAHDLDKAA